MFGTLATILKWLVLLPLALAVLLLSLANDQAVTVHLNPFDADDPVLRLDLALYQIAFIIFLLGALMGGIAAWSGQRKYRRRSRARRDEAERMQARADRSEVRRQQESRPSAAAGFLPRPERS